MFRKKTSHKPILTRLTDEMKNGKYSYAAYLLQNIFYVDDEDKKLIAVAILQMLSDIPLKRWYEISISCKGSEFYYPSDFANLDFLSFRQITASQLRRDKFSILTDDEYNALMCIAVFYHNGYIREECLKQLAPFNGYLRYYYLCVNDWVWEIRERAASILLKKLRTCPLYEIIRDIPVLEKLRLTKRRCEKHIDLILGIICERLRDELERSHLDKLIHEEPVVRNLFYKFGCENSIFRSDHFEYLIDNEPFGNNKERLLLNKFSRFGTTDEEYNKYILHKCPNVRYTVMLHKYEAVNNAWDGLEDLLSDPSAKVRSLAVFILTKYKGFNAREYFLGLIGTAKNNIAVSDIGLYGIKDDAELIKPYISEKGINTARKALHSYGRLMGAEGKDVYWEQLCSGNYQLSNEAFRLISAYRIHYGTDRIWEEYQSHTGTSAAGLFILMLCNERGWERMKYLLELYLSDSVEDHLKGRIYHSIISRNNYSKIASEYADELVNLVNENRDKLRNIADELLFDISCARKIV